jgi:hypothetical protein
LSPTSSQDSQEFEVEEEGPPFTQEEYEAFLRMENDYLNPPEGSTFDPPPAPKKKKMTSRALQQARRATRRSQSPQKKKTSKPPGTLII